MRQLILHVGMHKTGTTSIQKSLAGLSESRVRYVDLGNPNHSGPMTSAFADQELQERRPRVGRTPDQAAVIRQRMRTRLEAELSQKGFDKFVISGEGLVHLSVTSLRDIRAVLMKHVDRVQVFAYVREPVGYSSSAFQQRIKGGYSGYHLTQANYSDKFSPFVEVFGRENFSVKDFSRSGLRNGSVVADFCHMWDIPFDPKREVRSNESISEPTLKLLHLFNRSGVTSLGTRDLKGARMAMIEALVKHFPGKFELPAQFRVGAIDPGDIEWLRTECGVAFEVEAPANKSMPRGELEAYLNNIEPETVASYRELLARLGIDTEADDSTVDLLNKHFNHCVEQGAGQPRVPAQSRRRAARLRASSP